MARLTSALFVLTIALFTFSSFPGVHAGTISPSFGANVLPDYVQVSTNINVLQNLTGLVSTFSLPTYNGTIAGSNSSNVASAVQSAIDEKIPRAKVSNLDLRLSSTNVSITTGLQWFNASLGFRLSGIGTLESGLEHLNMSWKSFSIAENVTLGSVEVNNIGQLYLTEPAKQLAQVESSSASSSLVTYQNIVNYFRVTPANLVSATAKVSLFNFTQLFPPLAAWDESYDSSSNRATWSLSPIQTFGIIVTTTSKEPQATPTTNGVMFTIHASISAPARSWVQGDSLVVSFSDFPETIMVVVMITGLVIFGAAFVLERRIIKRTFKRKPKR